ncbi:MAG: SCP2 sterol-binding domain-containing protein [Proteobacteria bacterium]|nr:SCP2 sterol-binding domain-containing protein [Pseudomonadota bacterium]
MSDGPTPQSFYNERIPAQFNKALDEQAELGEGGAKLLGDMNAVNATLQIVVEGDGGGTFCLNVEKGRMTSGDKAVHPPFMTLVHDLAAFEVLERESGDSALGFLGGLAGLAGEIQLTQSRIDNLAGLNGSLRFELTGEDGFSLLAHFGSEPIPDEPNCSISIDAEAYRQLRSGELNPQDAFMGGQIHIDGDMQMAMQLALALMSPD